MNHLPVITLRHLMIEGDKFIGMQYFSTRTLDTLIGTLGNTKWSEDYNMMCIPDTPEKFNLLFETFKGVAWINCRYFLRNKPVRFNAFQTDLSILKNTLTTGDGATFPEGYLQLLETKRYSLNTARTYISLFRDFMRYFKTKLLIEINEHDIRRYIQICVQTGKSASYQNQVINAIKFYYEQVLDMPQRFYEIERPVIAKPLPVVLSEQEIQRLLSNIGNLKHKAIVSLLYSSGLRRQGTDRS